MPDRPLKCKMRFHCYHSVGGRSFEWVTEGDHDINRNPTEEPRFARTYHVEKCCRCGHERIFEGFGSWVTNISLPHKDLREIEVVA